MYAGYAGIFDSLNVKVGHLDNYTGYRQQGAPNCHIYYARTKNYGKAMKFYDARPFALHLTPELITEAAKTLTIKKSEGEADQMNKGCLIERLRILNYYIFAATYQLPGQHT